MEPLAYGLCGLTPAEFGAMTPREFTAMAEARADQRNEDREFLASVLLPMIQAATRKRTTLTELLGGAYTIWKVKREARRQERTKQQED